MNPLHMGLAIGAAIELAVIALIVACNPTLGIPSHVDTAMYAGEQLDCVDRADSSAEANACRAASRARFCASYPQSPNCGGLDGGR